MSDKYLCGWRVRSELNLPELAPWSGYDREPDLVIRYGATPACLDDLVKDGPFLQIDRTGRCLLKIDAVADYLVDTPDEVVISPRREVPEVEIRVFLLASVLGIIGHKHGLLPLRASCIAIDGRAVVLCGPSGSGKSTAAAHFARRGYPVLADDVCMIDAHATGGPRVLPSCPRLKLWRDSLEALDIASNGLERNRPGQNKFHYLHRAPFPATAVPLSNILLLRTVDPGVKEQCTELLRPAEKIAALNDELFCPHAAAALGRTKALLAADAVIAGSTSIRRVARRMNSLDMERGLRPIEAGLAS